MKTCKKCQKTLSLDSFHKHRGFKDGRRSVCKDCTQVQTKRYYEENREKHLEACRDWQRRNQDKVRGYVRNYRNKRKVVSRRWIESNPQRSAAQKKLNYAVFKKDVVRSDTCQVCGKTECKIEGHHYDYAQPLNVIWVCTGCHGMIHAKYNKVALTA